MPYYIKRKNKKAHSGSNGAKTRARKKPDLVKKLDRVFSLYIRLRDTMPGGYVVDCGHFHSRRHMATRFSEDNAHAECRFCNRFSADHLIGYERNLIRKIGRQKFDLLNVKAHSACHYLDCELEEMIRHYTLEVKKLSTLKGIKVHL